MLTIVVILLAIGAWWISDELKNDRARTKRLRGL